MTDLDLIVQLRPDVPLPRLDELGTARGRLASAIAAESGAADRLAVSAQIPVADGPRRRTRRYRRRALVAAGALAAAAVVAGVLVAAPWAGQGQTSSGHAKIRLTVAQFLDQAAAALLRQSLPAPPGPNQFVYTETETSNRQMSQTWLSADGKRAGRSGKVTIPACAQLQKQQALPPATSIRYCTPAMTAGYLPDLPTRPGPLRRYLTSIRVITPGPPPANTPNWAANDTGKAVDYLMATTYLRPAQQAALFQLLAHTPGFTIVPAVRDAIGRPGVAIRWTYEGGTAEIILNPATYAYLGDRTTYQGETPAQYSGSALIKVAIVDQAGQQP